tara:strand:- start:903 stop:1325 length:423 start_codon:yes stop_codon:yes gene_type:complete
MDIRKVKKLIEMLESSNLEEIEIQEGEESVRLVKNKNVTSLTNAPFIASEVQTQEITEPEVITGNQIKSPMVGTFYSSPSPGAKPFSEPGDIIKEGDVVCIVEAMKMMNEIKSEFSGTIKKVHLDNADPVEFGQVLFTVE